MPQDGRDRYQNYSFRRRLQQARSYHRQAGPPSGDFLKFLATLRRLPLWLKIAAPLLLATAAYILLVPNFLTISKIQIDGLAPDEQAQTRQQLSGYFSTLQIPAEKNLLLFSQNKLRQYILSRNIDVLAVVSVRRIWPHTLKLTLLPRKPSYLLNMPDGQYIISEDGLVTQFFIAAPTSTTASLTLLSLTDSSDLAPQDGQRVLPVELAKNLQFLRTELASLGLNASTVAMSGLKQSDIVFSLAQGFKIIFNDLTGLPETARQLRLLLADLGGKKDLYYIDMRFANKGFVCYRNTPCTQPAALPTTTPTSTLPIIKH